MSPSKTVVENAWRAGEVNESTGVEFPLRVAAVDVGSNAIRFTAAEFSHPGRFGALAVQRVPIRLGHAAFLSGRLTAESMDAAVEAFEGFRAQIDSLGVKHVRAVATSAVRESKNGSELVARVRDATDLEIHMISGSEEARLVWTAVRDRIDFGKRKWMLVDLGGGSVEVSLVDDAGILWSESHTMGSVRLLEELAGAADAPGHFRMLLGEYASTLRIPAAAKHWYPVELIATGGNIEALARLADAESDERGVSRLPREDLRAVIDTLSRLSYAQRVDELRLREDRADVILPAAVVYDRLAVLSGAEHIWVPHVGVREGVLLDLVDEVVTGRAHWDRQERLVRDAALTLGRRYLFDEEHARHVTFLALSLFDQLAPLHELDAGDRRLLAAAGLLHDIGQHISYRRHHKHSLYLIQHSELVGLSPDEVELVALIARYHRRAEPKEEHYLYAGLGRADRKRVKRLAGLLRVADALDREHLQQVEGVKAADDGREVTLELFGEGSLLLEHWALKKKGRMFERVFDRKLKPTSATI